MNFDKMSKTSHFRSRCSAATTGCEAYPHSIKRDSIHRGKHVDGLNVWGIDELMR